MSYKFRPAKDSDRDWAYELKKDAYRDVVERQFGPWDEQFQVQFFDRRWNPAISKIVTVDGVDIGLVATEERSDCIRLDEIQLIKEWRGRGIGTKIVTELISEARQKNKPIRLQVLRENVDAQRLYERLGFAKTGTTETHSVMEAV